MQRMHDTEKYNTTASTNLPASSAAIWHIAAIRRAINTGFAYLFSYQEIKLIERCFATATKNLPLDYTYLLLKGLNVLPYRWQQGLFNTVGDVESYDEILALRNVILRSVIELQITQGAKQIVLLKGGYTTTLPMLALKYSDIKFYELDRAATQAIKLDALVSPQFSRVETTEHYTKVNQNLFYIPDIAGHENIETKLISAGFIKSQKSLILGAGLSMYLTEAQNIKLLKEITSLLNINSLCILSFLSNLTLSPVASKSINMTNEAYQFSRTQAEAMQFVWKNGLTPLSYFKPELCLDRINKHDANRYYAERPEKATECVLLLQTRGPEDVLPDPTTLKLMPFTLPHTPPEQPTCHCMSGFLP